MREQYQGLTAIEQMRIVSMREAARLSGLSAETLRRHHRDKVLQLSPRRQGMRLRDALQLTGATKQATA